MMRTHNTWEGEAPAEPREGKAPAEPREGKAPAEPREGEAPAELVHRRKHPAHGVILVSTQPTIVFLTVCTRDRIPWLSTHETHRLLREVWQGATAWLVGRYVLMPEHIHLFTAPGEMELPLENWVRYWKSQFTKQHGVPAHRWQADHWDTRLRSSDSHEAKWDYVRHNPVRRGLVSAADDWPFQGELHDLWW